MDNFGYVIETGWFDNTSDFNSGTGVANLTSNGLEDVFVTRFRVCYPTVSTINASSCSSYTSPSGNHTWTSSGVYTDVLSNVGGFYGLITINLTVNNSFFTQSITNCGGYLSPSGDTTWMTSGTYLDTIPNSVGCDSIIALQLAINSNSSDTLNENSCGVYTAPDGLVYASSGQYLAIIPNSIGCDSNITINLSVTSIDTSVTVTGHILTSNSNGLYTYQWLDCDKGNSPISGATSKSFTPSVNGNYAVEITDGVCVEQSNCNNVTGVGVMDLGLIGIQMYPNPVDHKLKIDIGNYDELVMCLKDVTGKVLFTKVLKDEISTIDLSSLSSGVYFVSLNSRDTSWVEKILVR